MRLQYSKTNPRNLICKLLLNSLYGRFGLSPVLTENIVMSASVAGDYIRENDVLEFKPLGANRVLVSNQKISNERLGGYDALNISIGIPIFVGSYGQMAIHDFKEKAKKSLLYSDTDCVHLIEELDPKYIGNKLGDMKLEGVAPCGSGRCLPCSPPHSLLPSEEGA